MLVKGTHPEK